MNIFDAIIEGLVQGLAELLSDALKFLYDMIEKNKPKSRKNNKKK